MVRSADALASMRRMLHLNAERRPKAVDVLSMPYFAQTAGARASAEHRLELAAAEEADRADAAADAAADIAAAAAVAAGGSGVATAGEGVEGAAAAGGGGGRSPLTGLRQSHLPQADASFVSDFEWEQKDKVREMDSAVFMEKIVAEITAVHHGASGDRGRDGASGGAAKSEDGGGGCSLDSAREGVAWQSNDERYRSAAAVAIQKKGKSVSPPQKGAGEGRGRAGSAVGAAAAPTRGGGAGGGGGGGGGNGGKKAWLQLPGASRPGLQGGPSAIGSARKPSPRNPSPRAGGGGSGKSVGGSGKAPLPSYMAGTRVSNASKRPSVEGKNRKPSMTGTPTGKGGTPTKATQNSKSKTKPSK
jgi:hypothetical protein